MLQRGEVGGQIPRAIAADNGVCVDAFLAIGAGLFFSIHGMYKQRFESREIQLTFFIKALTVYRSLIEVSSAWRLALGTSDDF